MIKRDIQVITQGFRPGHNGADLRCVNMLTRANQDVIAPETLIVKRQGCDSYGNFYLIATPGESGYFELKFIHINKTDVEIGQIIERGEKIGRCILGGNSASLHLHFEVWQSGPVKPIDPVVYFDKLKIPYKYK